MYDGILWNNKILDCVVISMVIAQGLKVIISFFKEKKLNFRYFLDTGKMPSSHTASVTSLATAVGILEGLDSVYFAISAVFATVVMFDATGVRRAAGKQAQVLNKIVDNLKKKEGLTLIEENLKELIGHTPMEVFVGAIIGILLSLIILT